LRYFAGTTAVDGTHGKNKNSRIWRSDKHFACGREQRSNRQSPRKLLGRETDPGQVPEVETRGEKNRIVTAKYVLDACAIIALLTDEAGADVVESLLVDSYSGKVVVYMNKLNLLEVYYGLYREYGKAFAHEKLEDIKRLPLTIVSGIEDDVFFEAAELKAKYRMSLADSIALAEASTAGASLVTADHHELDAVDRNEKISFLWIR
ncbi:type II toxin-antitoxin system VapC family toxin, partial [Synergistaceae bacterium OttesenSCG-928-I11]|nr:type II toxin-antitoxin system VapC family toxin [Synergistaceae bacterium OttesenSCG-928-I11]